MISIPRQYPIKSQKQAGKHTHKTGPKKKATTTTTTKVQKTARQKGILSGILEFAFCTHPKEAQHLVHRDSSVHFGITQTLVSLSSFDTFHSKSLVISTLAFSSSFVSTPSHQQSTSLSLPGLQLPVQNPFFTYTLVYTIL